MAEAYPDLKANQTSSPCRPSSLDRGPHRSARRYYNATVRDLNTKVETVPTNIVANLFKIERAEYFEAVGEQREAPKVDFGQREATIPRRAGTPVVRLPATPPRRPPPRRPRCAAAPPRHAARRRHPHRLTAAVHRSVDGASTARTSRGTSAGARWRHERDRHPHPAS